MVKILKIFLFVVLVLSVNYSNKVVAQNTDESFEYDTNKQLIANKRKLLRLKAYDTLVFYRKYCIGCVIEINDSCHSYSTDYILFSKKGKFYFYFEDACYSSEFKVVDRTFIKILYDKKDSISKEKLEPRRSYVSHGTFNYFYLYDANDIFKIEFDAAYFEEYYYLTKKYRLNENTLHWRLFCFIDKYIMEQKKICAKYIYPKPNNKIDVNNYNPPRIEEMIEKMGK